MTVPVETTAAMTPPAEQHDPAGAAAEAPVSASGAAAMSDSAAVAGVVDGASEQGRRELSSGAVMALFGGLVTTLLGALIGLMMWQFNSLGDRIDAQGDRLDGRIDSLGTELRAEMAQLGTELRAEIGDLRAEMQAGLAEVTVVLLDHTDRLARLETAAGLPRPTG